MKCQGHHGAEHDPIEFEGYFTVLCPLCAALQSVGNLQFKVDTLEGEAIDAQSDLERAEENEKEAKDELDDLKADSRETIQELTDKIKELEAKL